MLRSAAFASSVVASTPTVLPLTNPALESRSTTQVNTARCVSMSISRRVLEIVEWVRRPLLQFQPQKRPHAKQICRPPGHPPFRLDLFEVSQHQESKIPSRRQTPTSHRGRVKCRTQLFNVVVKTVLLQNPIQSRVKRMRRAPWQILRCHPHRLLTMFSIAFTHGHARTLREDQQISREKYRSHFYHGLLGASAVLVAIASGEN